MKPVNILSLLQAKDSLSDEVFNLFKKHQGISIKESEMKDLKSLSKSFKAVDFRIADFNGFYVGYKIPQIGKEFDLLRFSKNSILNIELKSICPPKRQNHSYYAINII